MLIKDRIKELRRVKASELLKNPKNWRKHPANQRKAMQSVLDSIGYADALIARETPDGLMLIDGHLRSDVTPDQEVPVLVVNLTEEESDIMLATLDPLAGMADVDNKLLTDLLQSINLDDTLSELIDSVAEDFGIVPPNVNFPEYDENNVIHKKISKLGKICHKKAKEFIENSEIPELTTHKLGRLRSDIREHLKDELIQIDIEVKKIIT